jgi:predicted HicB family RNase H-like nuclease
MPGQTAGEMRKTETMSLRVSSDFKRRLVEEAKKDKRSLANYIEATLTRLWQERDFDTTRRSKKST